MTTPMRRPRLRHGFLAAALLVVAALRAVQHDVAWVLVLGTAGLAEAVLAVAGRGRSGARVGDRRSAAARLPEASTLDRSLVGHRRHLRLSVACVVVCTAGAVSVLTSAPGLAVVLALFALVGLHRVRRARRSVSVLSRLAGQGPVAREGTA